MKALERALRRVTGLGFEQLKGVAAGTLERTRRERLGLAAAGWAFWTTVALLPTLIVLLTLYGLVADADQIERQVASVLGSVSAETRTLVSDQLRSFSRSGGLGWGLALGLVGLLWTASNGMANAIKAVALAYGERERRRFLTLRLLALAFTVGALVMMGAGTAIVAVVPEALDRAGSPLGIALSAVRWGGLVVLVGTGVAVLYRFAPQSRHGGWEWVIKAALIVSATWAAMTGLFSLYIRNFSNYAGTYGALAGLIILMLWFYLTAFLAVAGAAIAAEMWEIGAGKSAAQHRSAERAHRDELRRAS
jgi:membrane protein